MTPDDSQVSKVHERMKRFSKNDPGDKISQKKSEDWEAQRNEKPQNQHIKDHLKSMRKGMFFNNIIDLMINGYFEVLISGILEHQLLLRLKNKFVRII